VIFLFLICSIISFNHVYAESSSINIENTFYEKSDIISIWGTAPPNPQNSVFITIKDSIGNTVWTEKLTLDEKGEFSTLVIAGISNWSISGNYDVVLESGDIVESKTFFYDSGTQVNPPSVIDEYYISQEDLILTFTIAVVAVTGIFVYLARNIILRRKTKYDEADLASKKDRDYEKYHSDWTDEEIFGSRKSTINTDELRDMYNSKSLPDYYLILGLTNEASSSQIKNQYRKLAKQYHPDRNDESTEEKMAEINKAYEVLSDEKLKVEYDKFYKLI
jgi:molecular chaperone DnaJ|tara:strand:+ start:227 stop:1057 length:831 start_codon:yes stop_codon:yes gene_type:complete